MAIQGPASLLYGSRGDYDSQIADQNKRNLKFHLRAIYNYDPAAGANQPELDQLFQLLSEQSDPQALKKATQLTWEELSRWRRDKALGAHQRLVVINHCLSLLSCLGPKAATAGISKEDYYQLLPHGLRSRVGRDASLLVNIYLRNKRIKLNKGYCSHTGGNNQLPKDNETRHVFSPIMTRSPICARGISGNDWLIAITRDEITCPKCREKAWRSARTRFSSESLIERQWQNKDWDAELKELFRVLVITGTSSVSQVHQLARREMSPRLAADTLDQYRNMTRRKKKLPERELLERELVDLFERYSQFGY